MPIMGSKSGREMVSVKYKHSKSGPRAAFAGRFLPKRDGNYFFAFFRLGIVGSSGASSVNLYFPVAISRSLYILGPHSRTSA